MKIKLAQSYRLRQFTLLDYLFKFHLNLSGLHCFNYLPNLLQIARIVII